MPEYTKLEYIKVSEYECSRAGLTGRRRLDLRI